VIEISFFDLDALLLLFRVFFLEERERERERER